MKCFIALVVLTVVLSASSSPVPQFGLGFGGGGLGGFGGHRHLGECQKLENFEIDFL